MISRILPGMATAPKFWLMKSEPDVFSLADLKNAPAPGELWDGIRNYQARNFMRDDMKRGDGVLFYHSRGAEPSVVGLARIVSEEAVPDPTQFDPKSNYFDPKATRENPRWVCVRLVHVAEFPKPVTLKALKADAVYEGMGVIRRGQRLSIQPVDKAHFMAVCKAGGLTGPLARLKG